MHGNFGSEELRWRKSRRSALQSNCVEIAHGRDGSVHLRDSKDPHGGILTLTSAGFSAFLSDVKDGKLDLA
ncbi:DUF397 domain-containing protein [Actinoplanes sp. N902-109]|uniref:DUF397 domain-containing protein n=1 Tax=Actinoplanes sp. (strain N902-109) TaxID=649831 RepID=UPI000A060F39|nr:DUF397 domain-containing protein [Actinoplanes sp. N902-109]